MKTRIKAIFSLFITAALLAASPAFAAEEDNVGLYVAPEIGTVTWRDFSDLCDAVRALGDDIKCEDSTIGFGVSGGYRFGDFLAVEGGYRIAQGFELGQAEADVSSLSFGMRGFFPVYSSFFATAVAGFHFWDLDADEDFADDADGTDPYFGIGGEFAATDNISIRASYTRYEGDGGILDYNVDFISGSIVWRF